MADNPFLHHVRSIPNEFPSIVKAIDSNIHLFLEAEDFNHFKRIYLVGCGDSYHAGLATNFAFQTFTRSACWSQTAMEFSRYSVSALVNCPDDTLVVGISSSGKVSRTIEALDLANKIGAKSLAITSQSDSPLAATADALLLVPQRKTDQVNIVIPGGLSYLSSVISLLLLSLRLSQRSATISEKRASKLLRDVYNLQEPIGETIENCDEIAKESARDWRQAPHFVYCGAGPNYGTALFSAAKLVEASGVVAWGQDLEEWAHIDYFSRHPSTPTIIISAGARDKDRFIEIAAAAQAISRDVALVVPQGSKLETEVSSNRCFPISDALGEILSVLVTPLPAMLLAAHHAEIIGESYFRGFSGGRSPQEGGGASKIQSSHRLRTVSQ